MSLGTELLATIKKDPIDRCPFRPPPFVIPDTYLPVWHRLPLCRKLPAKTNPDDPVIFSRPRLGKSLYHTFIKKDFDTSPYKDLPLDYNALHDPHLHRYFRINRRNYLDLVQEAFVSPFKDTVSCTQAEFNQYREYIRSIMVQQEKERWKIREKTLKEEQMQRHADRLLKQKNRPLEWVKTQLRLQKKHRIDILDELEFRHVKHEMLEEDDEFVQKDRKKTEFLKEEDVVKRELDQVEVIKEMREAATYYRKEIKDEAERKKAMIRWNNLEVTEQWKMDQLDELKRNYDNDFRRRAAQREKKHYKLWSKYKGLKFDKKEYSSKEALSREARIKSELDSEDDEEIPNFREDKDYPEDEESFNRTDFSIS